MVDWEARYVANDAPWELRQPSPPLVNLLNEQRGALGRVLVPGCGRGDDALYAASLGADVTGWDLAPTAIATAHATAEARGLTVSFAVRDALSPAPKLAGAFDTIVEHTFFCALAPDLRPRYVGAMAALLRAGGRLLGVFMTGDRTKGPPYGATEDELRALLAPRFRLERLARSASSPGHWAGREVVVVGSVTRQQY